MTKSRSRNGRKTNNRPLHADYMQLPQSDELPSESPLQPLNRFFHRSRGNGYAAIPRSSAEYPTDERQSPYFNGNANPFDNSVLVDIHPFGHRRPNSSNNNAMYTSDADTAGSSSRGDSIEEDVCFPPAEESEQGGIDFDALEEHIKEESRMFQEPPSTGGPGGGRRRRLSNMVDYKKMGSFYGDRFKHPEPEDNEAYRISFYSTAETSTIHARSFSEIPSSDETLSSMLKKGCFWIDVLSPTDTEMKALSKIFHIHPLTTEDITMEEPREKCEAFKNYYFVCFRSFDQDQYSVTYLQPLGMYIIILKEGILTFHFRPMRHPHNVRKRIKQLKDYIKVTPDWICYAILDDITDSFAPLIRSIEFEVDSIDELVLILRESEQSDMLRRIGYCRKRMMGLLRLLVTKADVVKTLKRGEARTEERTGPVLSNEVCLYLGDVHDHILTMLQALNHYEKISSRSHSNYLAQISIEMTQTNNEMNDVLSKLTALGSVVVPMNLVTGLWGMNVLVPGQNQEDLTWFFCITISILCFCVLSTLLMRYYHIL
ncbi:hypothetical protein VTP01DRAFT_4828 [Rhizomucor pusillus]|uniref:uncharacterized protein n=1 Tax=Rhizomucor pusillus TaxID=4840 RepID=UPI0037446A50